ncbi:MULTISPECIES: DUF1236 domain-containing protein [Rhodopseudomonas]|uniref:DUF1236 domain-containing protein n=1 Tax=Rhodopseudomonas palustris TaxID=1076 RepID=A0A0D7E7U9_RHOPL|nr:MULTISPECIES: DUF1236 domain-containing protein [Rhodopseudomonas]KIZ35622.1 hypothetical protein OO17_25585 [Rhodopseudomonas palustris]MDF3811076.1 DUF1236 domain-containing protein [Rhodopseudomonas sp. BAL398]WOK15547.1 DUF1236 domain-containing protein [Rhodopseudomonas sp. BAL398]
MKQSTQRYLPLALAASLMLSGVSTALAGSMSRADDSMSHATTGSAKASGKLTLSAAQNKTLWNDLSADASKQNAPASFLGNVGERVPSGLETQALPAKAASDVPMVKNYHYAMLQDKIVLVNPKTKRVAGVIRQ